MIDKIVKESGRVVSNIKCKKKQDNHSETLFLVQRNISFLTDDSNMFGNFCSVLLQKQHISKARTYTKSSI